MILRTMEIVPYGYTQYYAMKYDPKWTNLMLQLQCLFLRLKKQNEINRSHHFKEGTVVIASIASIPDEALYECMTFMDASSLLVAARVCKRWNGLSSRQEAWSNLLMMDFNLSVDSVEERNTKLRRKQVKGESKFDNAKCLYREMRKGFSNLIHVKSQQLSSLPAVPASFLSNTFHAR